MFVRKNLENQIINNYQTMSIFVFLVPLFELNCTLLFSNFLFTILIHLCK